MCAPASTCGAASGRGATADERRDVLVLNVSNNVAGRGMCGKHRGSLELLVAIDALWPPDAFDWIAKTDVDAFVVLPNASAPACARLGT